MREEKNEREQYRELNMMKHASSSSLQRTKKTFFVKKKTYRSTVNQAEVLNDVEGTCRRNKLAERWAS